MLRHRFGLAHFASIVAPSVVSPGPNVAAWPVYPSVILPVCTALGGQEEPSIISNGVGGAYVVWKDFRTGVDVRAYAERLRTDGELDPAWPADGRAVTTAGGPQSTPVPTIRTD